MIVRFFLFIFLTFTFTLSGIAQSKAIVTSANAFLRSKPGKSGDVRFKARKNSRLSINTKKDKKGWRFVSVNNKKGWVDTDEIKILVDVPQKRSVWLMIGKSAEANGFSLSYLLNITHLVRNGNNINFWIKIIPSNNRAYLKFLKHKTKQRPVNLNYNMNLMEGNCSTKKVKFTQVKLYWKNGRVENGNIAKSEMKADGNSAAKTLLFEACKIGKKL